MQSITLCFPEPAARWGLIASGRKTKVRLVLAVADLQLLAVLGQAAGVPVYPEIPFSRWLPWQFVYLIRFKIGKLLSVTLRSGVHRRGIRTKNSLVFFWAMFPLAWLKV